MRNKIEDRNKFISFINDLKDKDLTNNLEVEIAKLEMSDKISLLMGAVDTIGSFKEENLGTVKPVRTLRSITKILGELCKSYELSFETDLVDNNLDVEDETCIKSFQGKKLTYKDICLQLIGEYRMKGDKILRVRKRGQRFTEFNIYEFICRGDSTISKDFGEMLYDSGFLKAKISLASLSREDRARILISIFNSYSNCYFTLDKLLSIVLSGCDAEVLREEMGQYFNIVDMVRDILREVAKKEFDETLTLDLSKIDRTFLVNHRLMK
ncbi:hypothetical protein [Clostridium perfringens]|uniref:hypothetical protein n=1 Tax=Clostridium perfringens TaxID=1502 RepID=UPI0024BC4AD2|nr:hypothetical protein [Clostridium perfringens]